MKHHIRLTDDKPFQQPYRRIPPGMFEEVRQHLKEMLDAGAIRESNSPYCSNVVLVRKKDGSLRFCIDYRELNSKTIRDSCTLPRIDDTIDCLIGAKYFSKLDLLSGYWQCELAEEDKEKTAFSVGPLGFYEANRMPFGLTSAPATFQRLMETCMGDMNLMECLIFLDDVLVFSSTFEEHLERLEGVFQKLETHGLKLKPSKCEFFKTSVHYLGHVVSADGIHTDPDKISALTTWPVPVNIKTLRTFLGFTGYYRRFVKDYAKIVRPLNDLLVGHPTNKKTKSKSKRTKTPWNWTEECQIAFDTLVERLTSPPVLAYADFSRPFVVSTDASIDGLGAVLYQEQEGHERVIAYASRGLRPSERNYPAHKLEFLCLKWALSDKFHDYLYGNDFVVRTDNNPLTYVNKKAKLDATSHRWLASLANYNFKLVYKPGKMNGDADGLSRRPQEQREEMFPEVVKAICSAALVSAEELPLAESLVITNKSRLEPDNEVEEESLLGDSEESAIEFQALHTVDWKKEQKIDKSIARVLQLKKKNIRPVGQELKAESELVQRYLKEWKKFEIKNEVLYRNTELDGKAVSQLVLPSCYKDVVLSGLHDDVGHQGRDRTLWLVRQIFYWPGLEGDVEQKVAQCPNCIRRKSHIRPRAEMIPIESSRPLELVCIDFLGLERSKGGYENVLVITDHFTRYAQAIPTRNQTAQTTARVLYENFICHYSFPSRLHSDQGRNFESRVIKELCKIAGVEKTRTTPYHPMGNGMVERFNQTLIGMLGKLDVERKADWQSYVKPLVQAYNATKHDGTGYSPHYLMFGWHPRLAIDAFLGTNCQTEKANSRESYAKKLRRRLHFAYEMASQQAAKNSQRYKERFDRKVRDSTLQLGDTVLVRNVGLKGKCKLADKWDKQPYIVEEIPNEGIPVYKVKKASGLGKLKTLHRNMLLPFMFIPETQDRERQEAEIQNEKEETERSEAETTDSETEAGRYIIPQRRRHQTPPVSVHRSEEPVQQTSVDITVNDDSMSVQLQPVGKEVQSQSHTINHPSPIRTLTTEEDLTPQPRRSRRTIKKPNRFGEWV